MLVINKSKFNILIQKKKKKRTTFKDTDHECKTTQLLNAYLVYIFNTLIHFSHANLIKYDFVFITGEWCQCVAPH